MNLPSAGASRPPVLFNCNRWCTYKFELVLSKKPVPLEVFVFCKKEIFLMHILLDFIISNIVTLLNFYEKLSNVAVLNSSKYDGIVINVTRKTNG